MNPDVGRGLQARLEAHRPDTTVEGGTPVPVAVRPTPDATTVHDAVSAKAARARDRALVAAVDACLEDAVRSEEERIAIRAGQQALAAELVRVHQRLDALEPADQVLDQEEPVDGSALATRMAGLALGAWLATSLLVLCSGVVGLILWGWS